MSSEGTKRVAIPRHMGLIDASVIIIGQVIGTGIFLTPKGMFTIIVVSSFLLLFGSVIAHISVGWERYLTQLLH